MTTTAPPSSSAQSSSMHTASAPSGSGAPVMIRAAWPGPMAAPRTEPAMIEPTTPSRTGCPAPAGSVSPARRA